MDMTKKNDGFMKKVKFILSREFKIFRLSISQTSLANFLSILCDTAIIISYYLATSFFSNILVRIFSDPTTIGGTILGRSEFLFQSTTFILSIGFLFASYFITIVAYSLLQGFVFSKYLKKEYGIDVLLYFLKNNLVYAFLTLFVIFLVRFLFADPLWRFVNLGIIILFVLSLPIFHKIAFTNKKGKIYANIKKSLGILFSNIRQVLFSAFIIAIVMTALLSFTMVFGLVSYDLEMFMTFFIGLAVLSWAKRYMIILVRLIEK